MKVVIISLTDVEPFRKRNYRMLGLFFSQKTIKNGKSCICLQHGSIYTKACGCASREEFAAAGFRRTKTSYKLNPFADGDETTAPVKWLLGQELNADKTPNIAENTDDIFKKGVEMPQMR